MEERRQLIALRPLEIKHLFDFAIRIYRYRFTAMFIAMAVAQLPLVLLSLPLWLKLIAAAGELQMMQLTGGMPDMAWAMDLLDQSLFAIALAGCVPLYQVFILPLANLTCARLATRTALNEEITLGEAFAFARRRYWPTQVALAIYLLPLLVLSLLILLPVLAAQNAGSETAVISFAITGLLLIPLAGFAMWLIYPRFFMALSGIIQCSEEPEGSGIMAQGLWYLRRAWELSAGNYARLGGLLLMMAVAVYLITQGISEGTNLLLALIDAAVTGANFADKIMDPSQQQDVTLAGLTMTITSFVALVIVPVWQCLKTLLYLDLRCRNEALDLHVVLDRLEQAGDA
ncbi:hypothetical protein JW859_00415 [bacterium]|nr:hypothetical protein [bacterium]